MPLPSIEEVDRFLKDITDADGEPAVLALLDKYTPNDIELALKEYGKIVSPIWIAACNDQIRIASVLISAGFNPELAINQAILNQNQEVATKLIRTGVKGFMFPNPIGLIAAACDFNNEDFFKAVLQHVYGCEEPVDYALFKGIFPFVMTDMASDWKMIRPVFQKLNQLPPNSSSRRDLLSFAFRLCSTLKAYEYFHKDSKTRFENQLLYAIFISDTLTKILRKPTGKSSLEKYFEILDFLRQLPLLDWVKKMFELSLVPKLESRDTLRQLCLFRVRACPGGPENLQSFSSLHQHLKEDCVTLPIPSMPNLNQ